MTDHCVLPICTIGQSIECVHFGSVDSDSVASANAAAELYISQHLAVLSKILKCKLLNTNIKLSGFPDNVFSHIGAVHGPQIFSNL